jgi:23S rRNA pseudouridine1911/1915/1917 synthase
MAVTARGRQAITRYRVVERFERATLLRCRLETGRTHQIRVHLGALGHPLVGDPVYGKRGGIAFPRQALHAERLRLLHPETGKTMEWQADPPADLQTLIKQLRNAEKRQSPVGTPRPEGANRSNARPRSRVER